MTEPTENKKPVKPPLRYVASYVASISMGLSSHPLAGRASTQGMFGVIVYCNKELSCPTVPSLHLRSRKSIDPSYGSSPSSANVLVDKLFEIDGITEVLVGHYSVAVGRTLLAGGDWATLEPKIIDVIDRYGFGKDTSPTEPERLSASALEQLCAWKSPAYADETAAPTAPEWAEAHESVSIPGHGVIEIPLDQQTLDNNNRRMDFLCRQLGGIRRLCQGLEVRAKDPTDPDRQTTLLNLACIQLIRAQVAELVMVNDEIRKQVQGGV